MESLSDEVMLHGLFFSLRQAISIGVPHRGMRARPRRDTSAQIKLKGSVKNTRRGSYIEDRRRYTVVDTTATTTNYRPKADHKSNALNGPLAPIIHQEEESMENDAEEPSKPAQKLSLAAEHHAMAVYKMIRRRGQLQMKAAAKVRKPLTPLRLIIEI